MEDLHHRRAPPYYQTRQASGYESVAAAELDPEHETYVVYVGSVSSIASPSSSSLDVHPIAGLIAKEAPTKVHAEYANFAEMFSSDLASELPKHTGSTIILSSWSMLTDSSDHLSHLQVLLSFYTSVNYHSIHLSP